MILFGAVYSLGILLTVLFLFAAGLRGETPIDVDDYGPCGNPDCGMCAQPGDCPGCGAEAAGGFHFDGCPHPAFITSAGEAAALFEQSVRDALWLTEVDELNRMWRA